MFTDACGMSTLMRPLGVRLKLTAPDRVKTPPALMVSTVEGSMSPLALKPTAKSSTRAAVAKLTFTPACSPASSMMPLPLSSLPFCDKGTVAAGSSGSRMVLSSATPEVFRRTVTAPLTVRPSRPTKLASP